jgi:putative endonuclease
MRNESRTLKVGKALGRSGEGLAVDYLRRQGYEIVGTNFRFDRAEVDVIAKDKDVLVFVEVKTRRGGTLGEPEEAVTFRKRDQIRKAAEGYLFEHKLADVECRFDVIAIKHMRGDTTVSHFRDVF